MVLQLQRCATGTNSIGEAFKIIQRGDADAMITGGTEAPITHMALAGFSASRALSTNDDKSDLSSIPRRSRWLRYG